jgi:hypothetical protein
MDKLYALFPCAVRNLKTEEHITTKFCVKLWNNRIERCEMLQIAYGNKILPQAHTPQGYFQEGRENTKDDQSSEQPKMTSDRGLVQKTAHITCKRVLTDI